MTDVLARPEPALRRPLDGPDDRRDHDLDAAQDPAPGALEAADAWVRAHVADGLWLAPTVVVAALVGVLGLGRAPGRAPGEGAAALAAWSLVAPAGSAPTADVAGAAGSVLGTPLLAAWATLTGALARHDDTVTALREASLAATLVAVVLLFALARRVGLSRPAAAGAGLLLAVPPLALVAHRTVHGDVLATPWLVAALLLATARRPLVGAVGAPAALAVAALVAQPPVPLPLLAAPLVVVLLVRSAPAGARHLVAAVATTGLVLVVAVVGVLVVAPSRPGVLPSSPATAAALLGGLWSLDPVLLAAGTAATLTATAVRRLRPWALTLLGVVAVAALVAAPLAEAREAGAGTGAATLALALPLLALVLAGVTDAAARSLRTTYDTARDLRGSWLVLVAVALVAAVPLAGASLRGLLVPDADDAATGERTRAAQAWVLATVRGGATVAADDAVRTDLARAGVPGATLVPLADAARADVVVVPAGVTDGPAAVGVRVATFGTGDDAVVVRRVPPAADGAGSDATGGTTPDPAAAERSRVARATAGAELARNPRLVLEGDSRGLLESGRVDARIVVALAVQLTATDVTVGAFPAVEGEAADGGAGDVRRQLLVTAVGGARTTAGAGYSVGTRWLRGLDGLTATADVRSTDAGLLATFSPDEPAGLLPGVTGADRAGG
ncbi:hypothetical protein [Cellulomonas marina]|uniref:Glycosyltransferase RgtA/B/C/D-like domain-containing protein n=1 Tax=Cellulomonas marina TaxID=988821 RepID=A0A1I1A0V4_9CELL|nr:hypothetical protein [Cellulomonas marina]GIG30297.1 hypothetical protein Cma02nite_28970 [Cellulomonas marina]SFB31447.1 hypothetical protein SAMN05421867_11421 [Cellulomonas marina]